MNQLVSLILLAIIFISCLGSKNNKTKSSLNNSSWVLSAIDDRLLHDSSESLDGKEILVFAEETASKFYFNSVDSNTYSFILQDSILVLENQNEKVTYKYNLLNSDTLNLHVQGRHGWVKKIYTKYNKN